MQWVWRWKSYVRWKGAANLLFDALEDAETGFGDLRDGFPVFAFGEELAGEEMGEEGVGGGDETGLGVATSVSFRATSNDSEAHLDYIGDIIIGRRRWPWFLCILVDWKGRIEPLP